MVNANPNPATFLTNNLKANQSDYITGFMTLTTQDSADGIECYIGCSNTDQIGLTFTWMQPSSAPSSTDITTAA